jgi:hypothetical protein
MELGTIPAGSGQPGTASGAFTEHDACAWVERPVRSWRRDHEYTDFVAARSRALRRIACLLCQDWHHADDQVRLRAES